MISFDTETTGLDPRKNKPTHYGIYNGKDFHLCSFEYGAVKYTDDLIMHNGKFDTLMMWWNHNVWIIWKYDTMLLSQLYDSRVKHKLDNLGELYLGQGKFGDKKMLQAIRKGEFWMLPPDTQKQYLQRDCELTYNLYGFFRNNLPSNLWKLYEEFDLPISLTFAKIETNGFSIDEELLNEYKRELTERKRTVSLDLQSRYGDINFNSPKQVLECLQRTHNIELQSTSERSLEVAKRYVPSIGKLLEYRELSKYLNTYIGGIEKHLWKGKIYPQYHLAGDYHTSTGRSTTTGRTSSSNPNLQNQPRSANGPVNIRQLFKASEGNVLMAFDFNQLELKVGAFLSGEKNLLEGDIHAEAAKYLKTDRNIGKTCNFALLYGAGKNKIYYTSGGSKYVDKYISWFEEKFPKVIKWCEETQRRCKDDKRVETYLGRVRFMDHPEAGPNSIIQGTAGDIGKEAVYQVHRKGYKVVGFVHDEILVEVPEREVQNATIDIPRIMTEGLQSNGDIHQTVKLGVSVKQGKNWGEMSEYSLVHK